jgi:hypothetical protein
MSANVLFTAFHPTRARFMHDNERLIATVRIWKKLLVAWSVKQLKCSYLYSLMVKEMNRTVILLSVMVSLFAFSCKKDYICKCKTYGQEVDAGKIKAKEKKASAYCQGFEDASNYEKCKATLVE